MNLNSATILWDFMKETYGSRHTSLFKDENEISSWCHTYARAISCTVEEMRYAVELMPTAFPAFPPTLGELKSLIASAPKKYIALPDAPRGKPTPEQAAAVEKVARAVVVTCGAWWVPERVKHQSQIDLCVRNAGHFGPDSSAAEFLAKCKADGIVTADNKLSAADDRP